MTWEEHRTGGIRKPGFQSWLRPWSAGVTKQSLNHSSLGFHELSNGNNTHLLGLMERLEVTKMSKYM